VNGPYYGEVPAACWRVPCLILPSYLPENGIYGLKVQSTMHNFKSYGPVYETEHAGCL
jgi:hypothetical protein